MKKMLLIVFYLLSCNIMVGEKPVIKMTLEELFQEESNRQNQDTCRRVDVLNELAFKLRNSSDQREKVTSWAQEALDLSLDIKYLKGQGDAVMRLGLLAGKNGEIEKAKQYYFRALILRLDQLQDTVGSAGVCNNLANLYKIQQDSSEQAIFYFKKGIDLLSNLTMSSSKAMLMNNLGGFYVTMSQYKKATLYLDSALWIREQRGHEIGIANTKLNFADLFQHLKNYEKSEKLLLDTYDIFLEKNDSAGIGKSLNLLGKNHYLNKDFQNALIDYKHALNFSKYLEPADLGTIIQNLGIIYLNLKKPKEALKNYEYGLALFTQLRDINRLAIIEFNLGNLRYDQQEFDTSISHYKKSLGYLKNYSNPDLESKVLHWISAAYTKLSQPDSALYYSSRYIMIRDSLFEVYQQTMNYHYNQKDYQAELFRLNFEKEKLQKKNLRIYGATAMGVLGLLLSLAVMAYFNSRQKRQLVEQEKRISQQRIVELIKEKETEANYARMKGEEVTRREIGKELHDGIGSVLSTVKLYFSSIEDKIDNLQEENRQQYLKANELLDEACEGVRKLSHKMVYAVLDKFGLKAQLQVLAETLQKSGQIEVELSTYGLKERLSSHMEINIYRMVQEMVTNVIKYAQAKTLSLQVNRFDEVINIMVEDNGVGFDVEKVRHKDGIGLENLSLRVAELGGTFEIDSRIGQGTSIVVDLPVKTDISDSTPKKQIDENN